MTLDPALCADGCGRPADRERRMPPPDGYDLVERFWEASWPTLASCPDECGTCKPCVAHWAVTWSLAALSNPDLVAKAEAIGPWKWTLSDGHTELVCEPHLDPTPGDPT